ncbi:hypothetical protein [Vampirovibrio sp.]|uniref:capsular polysaccharide export protein, LipB/KpsS family n=1 Tax=Vampirovibrio sp. TaxID=2717857 RepID=UPI003593138B
MSKTPPKTVLFYSVNTLMNTPNFAAELEIMAKHHEAGDEVKVLHCKGTLKSCQTNHDHALSTCFRCKSLFEDGIRKIGLPASALMTLPGTHGPTLYLPEHFADLETLKAFAIDDVDVGASVSSSLISKVKNHKLNPAHYQSLIQSKLRMALHVYEAVNQVLDDVQPDLVYFFNGRLAESRPVLRSCQKRNIACFSIDRAGEFGKYNLFENTLPHDLALNKKKMAALWQQADLKIRNAKGAQWFEHRRLGKDQGKRSFTKNQTQTLLPEGFDPTLRNIAIYNSSEYEYATIKGWKMPIYADQNDAILKLAQSLLETDPTIFLWVRVHPNLSKGTNVQMQELRHLQALNLPNLGIIFPESRVDSYALMDACEKVISFSSTMGVEAGYWGKPSILIGHAFYEDLGCCYQTHSHEETLALIRNSDLPSKPREAAIQYGYYQHANGYSYKRFEQTGFHEGLLDGKPLLSADKTPAGYLYFKALKRIDQLRSRIASL